MGIRILCLHGQGVNASIFQNQTGKLCNCSIRSEQGVITSPQKTEEIREMLPSDYEFFFLDGAYHCSPAPEVLDCFAPPYLTWYTTPTVDKVLDAHIQVRKCVDQHGPFDIVLGFSQVHVFEFKALLRQLHSSHRHSQQHRLTSSCPVPRELR